MTRVYEHQFIYLRHQLISYSSNWYLHVFNTYRQYSFPFLPATFFVSQVQVLFEICFFRIRAFYLCLFRKWIQMNWEFQTQSQPEYGVIHKYVNDIIRCAHASLWEGLSIRPSVHKNGRKWLGKQSECSKPVKMTSKMSQYVPKCP